MNPYGMRAALGGTVAVLACAGAAAQTAYPAQQIRIVCPFPAGGGTDLTARLLGEQLYKSMGQPVIVENRTGANGNIAMDLVARAAPDGHTLGLMADSQIAINPHLYKSMPLDPLRDLSAVHTVAVNQFVFKQPVSVGDLLSFYARVLRVGNTSVTVHVEVYAERNPAAPHVVKVTDANLTYVAIDHEGQPRPIPSR